MTGLRVSMALRLRKTRRGWEGGLSRWLAEKQRGVVWLTALMAAWLILVAGIMPGLVADRLAFVGGGSELLVDVGSFTKINTVTTQTVTLNGGKTWPPKAILFFTAGSNAASGTWDPIIWQSLGFAAGSADYSVGGMSNDNQATSETARRMAAKCLTFVNNAGSGVFAEADLQSFDAGGFTLNWTTNTAGDLTGTTVGYIALGGDIQAEVLNWTTPTATGNKSVNTGTFQPDLVFHIGSHTSTALPVSETQMNMAFGAMNSAGEQWAVSVMAQDNTSPSNTERYQRTDKCYAMTNIGVGQQATYVSMDATGFTINFGTVDGSARNVASLCIKGVKSKLGAFNKSTGAAPVTQSITAPGFSPACVLTATFGLTTNTTPQTSAAMSLGATDGANQRVVSQFDNDAANPTQADSVWYSTASALVPASAATNSLGTTAFTATGFDATWNPNGGAATEILYAALAAKD